MKADGKKKDFYGDVYIGPKKVDTIIIRSVPVGTKKERELYVLEDLLNTNDDEFYELAWVKKPNGLYDVKKGFRVIERARGLRRNPSRRIPSKYRVAGLSTNIEALRANVQYLQSEIKSRDDGIRRLMVYLQSSKFDYDPTVQVKDVLRYIQEIYR